MLRFFLYPGFGKMAIYFYTRPYIQTILVQTFLNETKITEFKRNAAYQALRAYKGSKRTCSVAHKRE